MKFFVVTSLFVLTVAVGHTQTDDKIVVTTDIDNFWEAYDAISAAGDSARQYQLLEDLFLERGSPGLHALMERRGYTAASYIDAINNYPRFWTSVRDNTLRANEYARSIEEGVEQLRSVYPGLSPARVYFTVGALMTGGTTLDSLVLIGSEIAMADSTVITDELPDRLGQNLRAHFDTNPIEDVALLNVHEYVHTQQDHFGSNLLSVSLQEGVAEFVSVLATGQPSTAPAVAFGEANEERVRDRFATEMFSPNWNDWLYNNFENEFGVRDLGYYVGYAIAKSYYDQADDEQEAVKRLIELDYQNQEAVELLVQESGYFPRSIEAMKAEYSRKVPTVMGIAKVDNGDRDLDSSTARLAVTFSAPMSQRFWGFDYGPLGEGHVLYVQRVVGFSEDGKTVEIEVARDPSLHQQVTLTNQFRTEDGVALDPYLIDLAAETAPAP